MVRSIMWYASSLRKPLLRERESKENTGPAFVVHGAPQCIACMRTVDAIAVNI